MRTPSKLVSALAALGLASSSLLLAPSAGATANQLVRQTTTCFAQKFVYMGIVPGHVQADFSATISGSVNSTNTQMTVTSVSYAFTNLKFVPSAYLNGAGNAIGGGTHNNVNFQAPSVWNSPDNLGSSGTITKGVNTFPGITVKNGALVNIRGIADAGSLPDPYCDATATVSWR